METWSTGMTKVGPMEVKKNHEFFFSKGPDFSRYSHRKEENNWAGEEVSMYHFTSTATEFCRSTMVLTVDDLDFGGL